MTVIPLPDRAPAGPRAAAEGRLEDVVPEMTRGRAGAHRGDDAS
jgi:hypothetical protein